jgi:hypothetical protein
MCWCDPNIRCICCGGEKCFPSEDYIAAQPAPQQSIHPAVWDLVIQDMQARDRFGDNKYKTRLRPFNGRDVLADAYQEALDLVAYLRQAIYERDKNGLSK